MAPLHTYLESLFDDRGVTLARALDFWRGGMAAECEFWRRWFATVGVSWQAEYVWRLKRRPLADWQVALLPAGPARVLDVGAAPLSSLGIHVPGRDVEIIAVDPLAGIYDEFWRPVSNGATITAECGRGCGVRRCGCDADGSPPPCPRSPREVQVGVLECATAAPRRTA